MKDLEFEIEMLREGNSTLRKCITELLLCLKEVVACADSDYIDLIANPIIYKYDMIEKANINISKGYEDSK